MPTDIQGVFISPLITTTAIAAHHTLVAFISGLLVLRTAQRARRSGRSYSGSAIESSPTTRVDLICFMLLLGFSLLCLEGAILNSGKPIIGEGFAPAGSFPSRVFSLPFTAWTRRLVDPFLLGFCVLLAFTGVRLQRHTASSLFTCSAASLLTLLMLESWALFFYYPSQASNDLIPTWLQICHAFFTCAFLVLWLLATFYALIAKSSSIHHKHSLAKRDALHNFFGYSLLVSYATTAVCFAVLPNAYFGESKPPMAGAHYYSWFPANWGAKTLGHFTQPEIRPALGYYNSSAEETFGTHLSWAKEAGLDFFIFDWWPHNPELRRTISQNSKRLSSLGGLRFCFQYESHDLKKPKDSPIVGEGANTIYLTPERIERLKAHWEYMLKNYAKNPQYLKIDNRPVIFVYASRHLVGPVREAILEAREHIRKKLGYDIFLVGDEVFLNALSYSRLKGIHMLPELTPDWRRLTAFDAITAYNPYDVSRPSHAGSIGLSNHIEDVSNLYAYYKAVASTAGMPFIPTAIPGYNDTGVRLAENHYVIPRISNTDLEGPSVFSTYLSRLVMPNLDRRLPMFAVTSWNEWNEWTQIEPSTTSAASSTDSSSSSQDYTLNESFEGYGFKHLIELQRVLKPIPNAAAKD